MSPGLLGTVGELVGVGGGTLVALAGAWYVLRAVWVGQRLANWAVVGAAVLATLGLGAAAGYVELDVGRLVGDASGLWRWLVDVVVPWVLERV